MEMDVQLLEIIVAGIGAGGVVAAALLGRMRVSEHKLKQAENELVFQRESLTFPEFVGEWADTAADLRNLMDETKVDRFMIFRAWNGLLEPRWTTSVFQMREEGQSPLAYIHFELDADYVDRVRSMVRKGFLYMSVQDLEDSAIKAVYDQEGVTGSYWAHLDTLRIADGSSQAITYCSFATHHPDGLTDEELTRCRIVASRLRGLALAFDRDAESAVESH